MNDEALSAHERDDEAFRARLAPLASEVLPPRPAAPAPRTGWTNRRAAAFVTASAAIVLGFAATVSKWPAPFGPATGATGRAAEGPPPAAPAAPALKQSTLALSTLARSGSAAANPAGSVPPISTRPSSVTALPGAAPPAAGEPVADMTGLLLRRGDAALADGDIIAARLLYERAAALGSAAAATRAGNTYDMDFLLRAGARGIRADPGAAAAWYRKAAEGGDTEARVRLARIQAQTRP